MVDRLLRQLKHADPTLKGDEPAKPPVRPPMPASVRPASPPSAKQAWLWVGLTAVLAIGVTQWPYAHACGWGLLGYSAVLLVWAGVSVWSAITSWRARRAAAHVVALVLVGLSLGTIAAVILPRAGYARVPATWRCVAAPAAPQSAPAAPPAAPQAAPQTVPPSGAAAASPSG